MSRKITKKETEKLFLFCEKHYVNHYDLQIELVDHLASAIEEQWKIDSELDFEDILKKLYLKFGGITGFDEIKVQKIKELHEKYDILLWKYFVEFYRLPKIIMTFVFTICLFLIFQFTDKHILIILSYFITMSMTSIFYFFYYARRNLKINLIKNKKFLLTDYIFSVKASIIPLAFFSLNSFGFYNIFKDKSIENPWIFLGVSFLMVVFTIFLYGYYFPIPKKIKEHFMEQFGEFAV